MTHTSACIEIHLPLIYPCICNQSHTYKISRYRWHYQERETFSQNAPYNSCCFLTWHQNFKRNSQQAYLRLCGENGESQLDTSKTRTKPMTGDALKHIYMHMFKGLAQDTVFAGVHTIKTYTWSFSTLSTKQFRSVQLSITKQILTIVIPFVFTDSNWVICMINDTNIAEYLNVD